MNFFSSLDAGISREKLESLDNVPEELKAEARRNCELHIDYHLSYPHYCVVQFQVDAHELRGFCDAARLKSVVLPRLAADNVRPLVVIKKATPTSDFLFLAVCDASKVEVDHDDDDDEEDSDVESPKSPTHSRATSAAKQRPEQP